MDLEIIIKTCDSNRLSIAPKACNFLKLDIIKKCVTSIALSAGQSTKSSKINIIDDASSSECIKNIKKILDRSLVSYEIIRNEKNNYFENTYKTFEIAKNSEATLVYCIDDDYLHEPQAIPELIEFYDYAFNQLGKSKDIVLCPNDDIENYTSRYTLQSHVVLGSSRHWRTNNYAGCAFMTTPHLLRSNWNNFEKYCMAHTLQLNRNNFLNSVWNLPSVQLFSPMPSIAVHLTEESKIDKFVNWKLLWDSVPDILN